MHIAIGICGKMHSGKDTVASIFRYIHNVGVAKAKYVEWYDKYASDSKFIHTDKSPLVFHFADKLKDLAAITFGIERSYFDNQDYKDNYYYDYRNKIFIPDKKIVVSDVKRLGIADFTTFEDIKKNLTYNPDIPYIKLRTLMQLYGDTMRKIFGDTFFINLAISDIEDSMKYNGFALIPDVRYPEEEFALRHCNAGRAYIVMIKRESNKDTKEETSHSSEKLNINPNYIINNNGTYIQLFYKVINVYKNILDYEQNLENVNNV